MIIAIAGASGFIGSNLTDFFEKNGNEVRPIPRLQSESAVIELKSILSGVDVVINLAGAPVVGRWTKEYKKKLFDSRINTTRKLVEAIYKLDKKPGLLISASAVGIYAQEGLQTETDYTAADDYLGEICRAWEQEAKKAVPVTRVVIPRFGIVLGTDGGALTRMIPMFKLGLGGKIASGKQGVSWIHINDVVQAVKFLIDNERLSGEFNFTAPEVVDNSEFTRVLAKSVRRPAFFSVPEAALTVAFGEGALAVAGGQFAPPKRLLSEGFTFAFPDLKSALKDIVK